MLKAAVPVTDDNGDLIGETKGKILVVDDEPDVVDMLRMMLENASYEVVSAYDGKEGIEKAKQEKPDAIVLDLMMPGMDRFEACKEMKNDPDLKDIPVLVLTAISRHFSDTKYARSLGLGLVSDDYIDKPVDPNVLLNRIAGLLGKL
ncbi:MAG: response regulator [Deltaproteobacteria bacterium]|nr:response regulator [Deltaproteobacteria bacterium]MBW2078447.1 response regulator [Deltaproteobacteria bacterium]